MPIEKRMLDVKLRGMEERLNWLCARLDEAQSESPTRLSRQINQVTQTCREDRQTLSEMSAHAKSPIASKLAEAQMRFLEETRRILGEVDVDHALLAAEDAIDLAVYMADEALLTSLKAIKTRGPAS